MQTRDRLSLDRLHIASSGTSAPTNFRDASGSASVKVWTKQPYTIIPGENRGDNRPLIAPRTSPRLRTSDQVATRTGPMPGPRYSSDKSNPYSNRMHTNLNSLNKAVGNVVAQKTVFHTAISRSSKRQKTDSAYRLKITDSYSTRRNSRGSGTAEIIDLEGDTEDTGSPVVQPVSSPDPINMINGTSNQREAAHPFDAFSNDGSRIPADGPSTIQMRRKLIGHTVVSLIDDCEVESIQDADDVEFLWGDPRGRTKPSAPQRSNVREKIAQFDKHSTIKPPHFDLRKMSQMKGKQPSDRGLQLRAGQKDPIATSATRFSGKSSVSKTPDPLPLEAWYLGSTRFPEKKDSRLPQCFLMREDARKLSIKQGLQGKETYLTLRIDKDLESFEYTRATAKVVILRFWTTGILSLSRSSKNLDHCFKTGYGEGDGTITIKFLLTHPKWSKSLYDDMISWLRGTIKNHTVVDESGASAIWESVNRGLEVNTWASSPKSKGGTERLAHGLGSDPSESEAPTAMERSSSPPDAVMEIITPPSRRNATSDASADNVPARPKPRQKSSNKDAENGIAGPSETPRRSARLSAPKRAEPSPSAEPDELILVYPPDVPGAVNITNADLRRLHPGEFLNDTLIEFGLKLWLNELRAKDPALAESIHVFSSFFYKKLNKKNLEEGYQSIRKWTLKIDLFKKKYIIVPINENLHWYLAIIYQPEHFLRPPPSKPPTRGRSARIFIRADLPGIAKSAAQKSRPQSPSEAQGEAEVEALLDFESSCSISPHDHAGTLTISASPLNVKKGNSVLEHEPMTIDTIPRPRRSSSLSDFSDDMVVERPQLRRNQRNLPHNVSPTGSKHVIPLNELRNESPEPWTTISESSPTNTSECNGSVLSKRKRQEEHVDPVDSDFTMEDTSVLRGTTVDPVDFYASAPQRPKRKEAFPLPSLKANNMHQEDETTEMTRNTGENEDSQFTYIFTLDSLGSQHRQAINILRHFLKMEAKDKRGVTETSEVIGKRASVPTQPNYCDCGIYLLHFAETFMTDPNYYCRTILLPKPPSSASERQSLWKDENVGGLREQLASQVLELSEQWKAERTAKEEQRKKEVAEGKEVEQVVSSDDEIDIVEDVQVQAAPSKPKSKAARFRG